MIAGGFPADWQACWPEAPGFGVYVLRDPDAPLEAMDDAEFAGTDERLPYFASLWPSGISLAGEVLTAPPPRGPDRRGPVLDLGCGVGAEGLAAAWRGQDVSFLDWDPRALELVACSARHLGRTPAALWTRDWRALDGLGRFAWILAADVLYESRNVPAVLAALSTLLAEDGEAWLSDPGRAGLGPFCEDLPHHGLRLLERRSIPHVAHSVDVTLLRVGR